MEGKIGDETPQSVDLDAKRFEWEGLGAGWYDECGVMVVLAVLDDDNIPRALVVNPL